MSDAAVRRLARSAMALFVVAGALLSDAPPTLALAAAAVALLAVLLLPVRGPGALGAALVGSAAVTALCSGSSSNVGWFTLCLFAGWCALERGLLATAVTTTVACAVFLVEAVAVDPDPGWANWVAGTVFAVAICLMGRRQRGLLEQLRAAQAGLAATVRAEERARVARELHDVIGHSLTVSLLHVTGARLAVEEGDAEEAAQALALAEELGRQSLTEVRHAVGLLRAAPDGRDPLPGAAQLPGLVDGFRRAGAQVAYDVVGDPAALPATTALTVYRILQESLTNAVRHGTGARAAVTLAVGGPTAELTVDSPGPLRPGARDGSGVTGMRERAEALGGRLSAGPSGDGWRVHAVLPS